MQNESCRMKHQTSNGDTEKRVIDTSTTKYTYPTSIEKKVENWQKTNREHFAGISRLSM